MTRAIKEEFEEVLEYDAFESDELLKQAYMHGIGQTLKPAGKNLSDYLRSKNVTADFLICQGGNACIPFYDYSIPLVSWHDCNWHTFLQGYSDAGQFERFRTEHKNFYHWDQTAMEKTDLLIYSSAYVAEASIRNYKVPAEKVSVIPFGANLHATSSPAALENILKSRLSSPSLNLTFLGKDWKRKGLYAAFCLARQLNASGVPAHLNIIGCDPAIEELTDCAFVTQWGFLDKSNQAHTEKLHKILEATHFLVHPAFSEPFGICLCEANAYGIPVIGTDREGLKTIVINGLNGYLFPIDSLVTRGTALIKDIVNDFQNRYPVLFYSSLNQYHQRLNWKSGVSTLRNTLQSFRERTISSLPAPN